MRIRLEPSDEYMHVPDEATTYNESMYFNVYDAGRGVGGFFRLGNRPNEGYAEMTICLWLPDASTSGATADAATPDAVPSRRTAPVGFMFARPRIGSNDAFDAGGMRFEVVEPFEELTVEYEGPIAVLDDPLAMANPREAFASAPHADASVALTFRGVSPMWGGEPEFDDADRRARTAESLSDAMEFARGHYEQHVRADGTITVGADTHTVEGFGLRDHSWGPRRWQAPDWYRWLTCNAGADAGFMVSVVASRNGRVRRSGILLEAGRYTPIVDAEIATEWTTDAMYHDAIRCTARTPDREIEIVGRVLRFIPLRNRREGAVTRIGEGLTEYRWDDKVGYGLSEYLDQIVDGRPSGL